MRQLFTTITERSFLERLGWPDLEVISYLSDLLTDFAHIDSLYRIRDAVGRPVEDVAEMLAEASLFARASSLDREREVHKHIGDYTLFMTGLFPRAVERMGRPGGPPRVDALIDYTETGKRSYRIVAEYATVEGGKAGPLFRKLSAHFELCAYGLGYVREDLEKPPASGHVRLWRNPDA